MGAPARCDLRDVLFPFDFARPDLVGPDPGRVDDVVGLDDHSFARCDFGELDLPGLAALLQHPGDVGAVQADRAEALGLAQHGEDEPRVIGLAVIEEVGRFRVARLQGRDQFEQLFPVDRPVPVR